MQYTGPSWTPTLRVQPSAVVSQATSRQPLAQRRGAYASKGSLPMRRDREHRPRAGHHPNDLPKHFDPEPCEMLAPMLPAWGRALKNVDRSRPAPHCDSAWKYWVPDPATLVRYPNPSRVHLYLTHWVELRRLWYPRLAQMSPEPSEARFRSKQWTDLLDVGPAKDPSELEKGTDTGTRRLAVIGRFSRALGTTEVGQVSNDAPLWYGSPVRCDHAQAHEITWEIAQIGFLDLGGNRGVVFYCVETAENEVEEADGKQQLGMKLLYDCCKGSAGELKVFEALDLVWGYPYLKN